ncbi:MAG: metal-sulfur cluster assembly factor [Burkholderiales bacterium]|nr:metal-sulfur cluster assembly factor [Burkholderiales bacterium]
MAKPRSLGERLRGLFGGDGPAAPDAAPPGAPAEAAVVPESRVRDALRTVVDPEVGIDIVALGLVYAIETSPGRVRVDMTMTTPACPSGPQLRDEAARALEGALPEAREIDVRLVWDPPWTPARMSAAAKKRLGW